MSPVLPASVAPVEFTQEELAGLAKLLGVESMSPFDGATGKAWYLGSDEDYITSDAQLLVVLLSCLWALGYTCNSSADGMSIDRYGATRATHFGPGHAAYRLAMAALKLPEAQR
jgi:hypothetical protein